MNERVRMGTLIVRTVAAVFPYLCFGKKSYSWSNTELRPNVLLKRLDRCNLEQFEASQHKGRSRRKVLIVRTVERPDGITRCPDGCKGTELHQSVQYFTSKFTNLLRFRVTVISRSAGTSFFITMFYRG
jgi:hypothetical protein